MRTKANIDIFNATSCLKVLSCLADYPEKEFTGSELQKSTGISSCDQNSGGTSGF